MAYQIISNGTGRGPDEAVRPTFNPTFLDPKDEDCASFDHSLPLGGVQASDDARDYPFSGGVHQLQGVDGGLYVSDKRFELQRRKH